MDSDNSMEEASVDPAIELSTGNASIYLIFNFVAVSDRLRLIAKIRLAAAI